MEGGAGNRVRPFRVWTRAPPRHALANLLLGRHGPFGGLLAGALGKQAVDGRDDEAHHHEEDARVEDDGGVKFHRAEVGDGLAGAREVRDGRVAAQIGHEGHAQQQKQPHSGHLGRVADSGQPPRRLASARHVLQEHRQRREHPRAEAVARLHVALEPHRHRHHERGRQQHARHGLDEGVVHSARSPDSRCITPSSTTTITDVSPTVSRPRKSAMMADTTSFACADSVRAMCRVITRSSLRWDSAFHVMAVASESRHLGRVASVCARSRLLRGSRDRSATKSSVKVVSTSTAVKATSGAAAKENTPARLKPTHESTITRWRRLAAPRAATAAPGPMTKSGSPEGGNTSAARVNRPAGTSTAATRSRKSRTSRLRRASDSASARDSTSPYTRSAPTWLAAWMSVTSRASHQRREATSAAPSVHAPRASRFSTRASRW